jgi:hypothetical protein
MTIAALVDLGVPAQVVADAIAKLPITGYHVHFGCRVRSGIVAASFDVHVDAAQPTRTWRGIRELLAAAPIEPGVLGRARAIFTRLAEAESKVHCMPADDVHFHEVGAVDAIVDIVGTAAALEHLGANVVVSPLPMGRGFVRAQHGVLPLPPPAVVECLAGLPTYDAGIDFELVTPTGAAIVAALAEPGAVPELRVDAVGYGAGSRVLADRPNLLRIVLGEPVHAAAGDEVIVLEATIDDTSPELWEYALERLFEAGAKDAWLEPVVMKKSRPGVTLRVLAAPGDRDRLAAVVFAETSTIGLRWTPWRRLVLPRETRTVETEYGTVAVKIATAPDGTVNVAPEFEACRRLARARGVALKLVYQAALSAARR